MRKLASKLGSGSPTMARTSRSSHGRSHKTRAGVGQKADGRGPTGSDCSTTTAAEVAAAGNVWRVVWVVEVIVLVKVVMTEDACKVSVEAPTTCVLLRPGASCERTIPCLGVECTGRGSLGPDVTLAVLTLTAATVSASDAACCKYTRRRQATSPKHSICCAN